MKITRRDAIGVLAVCAAAETASAQQAASPAMNEPVTLSWLDEAAPAIETGVSWGVPFPRGAVGKSQAFGLKAANGNSLPLQSWPLAYWRGRCDSMTSAAL